MFGFKRLDKTFEFIAHAGYAPTDLLAKTFDVTTRTVRSDIAKINGLLEEHGAQIAMKRGAGYHLVVSDQEALDAFRLNAQESRSPEPDLSSTDDRIRYLLCDLLNSTDYRPYEDLAEAVYVGENTLQNYIRTIKDLLAEYDLALMVRAGVGVKILGREDNKRRCFMDRIVVRNVRSYVKGFSAEEAQLFPDIDLDVLERIIREHIESSDIAPTDYGFKNILMHTALMVQRVQLDCAIESDEQSAVTSRIKLFIDETCADLERAFSMRINQAERGYLLLHILSNTKMDQRDIGARLFRGDIDRMLEFIHGNYGFDLRNDAEFRNNLLDHLNATFASKDLKVVKRNPLLNTIRTNFPLAFEIALASTNKVFDTEPYTLSEDEVGYVALHLGAAIERRSPADQQRHRILLVCGSGNSIARMLESRLMTLFGDRLEIAQTVSYRELLKLDPAELGGIAFVVTTVPLERCSVPNILVDFALDTPGTEAISRMLNKIEDNRMSKVGAFFDENLFVHLGHAKSKSGLLELLCGMLSSEGIVGEGFLASVLERESLSDTTMDALFAIPHSLNPESLRTKVAVAVLDEPLEWAADSHDVRIVFLLAVRAGDRANIEHLYDLLIEVTNNRHVQQAVLSAASFDEFMAALNVQAGE